MSCSDSSLRECAETYDADVALPTSSSVTGHSFSSTPSDAGPGDSLYDIVMVRSVIDHRIRSGRLLLKVE